MRKEMQAKIKWLAATELTLSQLVLQFHATVFSVKISLI
jgi:hypothetical protein